MEALFVHTADNHLGFEQYGLKSRFNDFAHAFYSVVDDAIARKADCFLIAGDLFNKRAIDALTLIQAQEALQKLQNAGIPAIAIEGNHDRSYYRDGVSWLQFLCWQGVLTLLNPLMDHGTPQLTSWDRETMRGAYVDLKDGRLRIYGLPWYGASTARVIESFAQALTADRAAEDTAGVEYRVLLMHTGVEGMLPQLHGLPTRAQFEPLRGLVDYVALGHVHKPYCIDDWLYNPGSTETWGAEESAWTDRGYYVTRIHTDVAAGELRHTADHVVNLRRPFYRLYFKMDGLGDPATFYDAFARFSRMKAHEHGILLRPDGTAEERLDGLAPVVDVLLTGVMSFDASALETSRIEEIVRDLFHPLVVRQHNNTRDNEYDGLDDDEYGDGRDRSTRPQLELHIFEELLARDARYIDRAPQWAKALAEIKQMALGSEEPAAIARRLREARAELLP